MPQNNSSNYAVQESTQKTPHFNATCFSDLELISESAEMDSCRNQVSHIEVPERNTPSHITLQDYNSKQLSIDQLKCPELGPAIKFITNSENADLRPSDPITSWVKNNCGMTSFGSDRILTSNSQTGFRFVAPEASKKKLLQLAHQKANKHYNSKAMMGRLHLYSWRGMSLDVDEYVENCTECVARSKRTGQRLTKFSEPRMSTKPKQ